MRQRRKAHPYKRSNRKPRPQKSRRRTRRHVQRLLTAPELGAILRMSKKTLYAYAGRNIIPHVRIESNVRFPENDIAAWLERHTHRPPQVQSSPTS